MNAARATTLIALCLSVGTAPAQRIQFTPADTGTPVTITLRNYVWEGPHPRLDYAVVYNVPGSPKPLALPAQAARALVEHPEAQNQ